MHNAYYYTPGNEALTMSAYFDDDNSNLSGLNSYLLLVYGVYSNTAGRTPVRIIVFFPSLALQ